MRAVGLEHLSVIDRSPPDLVELASEAGFDMVGIRISPAIEGERVWPMAAGSPMMRDTLSQLAETGMNVLDVECVVLREGCGVNAFEPVLQAGAELGARFVNVIGADPDPRRVTENFAALVELAKPYRLRPLIEGIPYNPVGNLSDAVAIARASDGGGVLVDALHFRRAGEELEHLQAIDRRLLAHLQLCDAPLREPDILEHGETGDGTRDPFAALKLESRTRRLAPGEGELALRDLLAAMPSGADLAVEAPFDLVRRQIGDLEFARRLRRHVQDLITYPKEECS